MEPVTISLAVIALIGSITTAIFQFLSDSKVTCTNVSECCVFGSSDCQANSSDNLGILHDICHEGSTTENEVVKKI